MSLKKIFQKIHDADRRFGLLRKGEKILLAVSGGPDSMALLNTFEKMKHAKGYRIGVAHVEYGISPLFSRKASGLVEAECRRMGIPFHLKKLRLGKQKAKELSEERAREIRYKFFEQVCLRRGYQKMATAHTLDDQAETVLMRLFRGTGIKGMAGMSAWYDGRAVPLIRPMLFVRRSEVMEFVRKEHIAYQVDPTNNHPRYLRNRIRLGLIPWLHRHVNPSVEEALVDFQCVSSEAADYIGSQADRYIGRLRKKGLIKPHGWLLPRCDFVRMHPIIRHMVLEKALSENSGLARIPRRLRLGLSEAVLGGGVLTGQKLNSEGFVELRGKNVWIGRKDPR